MLQVSQLNVDVSEGL